MPHKAKISINVDTENADISVNIDGQNIENVEDINVFTQRDSDGIVTFVGVGVHTQEKLENGVVKRVSFFMEGTTEANAAIAFINPIDTTTIPGFVGVEDDRSKSKLRRQIQSFYAKK